MTSSSLVLDIGMIGEMYEATPFNAWCRGNAVQLIDKVHFGSLYANPPIIVLLAVFARLAPAPLASAEQVSFEL